MGEKFMSPLWPFSLKVRGALYEKFKIEKPHLLQPVEAYLKAKTAKPVAEVTTSAQDTKTRTTSATSTVSPLLLYLPFFRFAFSSVVVSPVKKKIDLLSEKDKEEIEEKLSLISEGAKQILSEKEIKEIIETTRKSMRKTKEEEKKAELKIEGDTSPSPSPLPARPPLLRMMTGSGGRCWG